jgi:hypothetical protein
MGKATKLLNIWHFGLLDKFLKWHNLVEIREKLYRLCANLVNQFDKLKCRSGNGSGKYLKNVQNLQIMKKFQLEGNGMQRESPGEWTRLIK